MLWAQNYGSPVVGIYVWHQDSLRRVPHLNLAMETLRYLTFHSQDIHVRKWSHQSLKDFTSTKTQLLYVVPASVAFALPVLGSVMGGKLRLVPALQASAVRGEARSQLLCPDIPGPQQRGTGGECPRRCACVAVTWLLGAPRAVGPSRRASRWPGSTAPPRRR